jgi:hypothetical protein
MSSSLLIYSGAMCATTVLVVTSLVGQSISRVLHVQPVPGVPVVLPPSLVSVLKSDQDFGLFRFLHLYRCTEYIFLINMNWQWAYSIL